ncbi:MAG: amidohydrolase family protein [Candidatus Riflebacteria bacterium]|nr:amidohydrolase family protein [Candidatus Riflebacteria bacterium]
MYKLLENGRILTPEFEIRPGKVLICDDIITGVYGPDDPLPKVSELTINLEGRIVFPALINCHDHMYETFGPRGEDGHFRNWFDWERDFLESPIHRLKQYLSIADLYALGMYRNAISGVGLVVDHFPREVSGTFLGKPLLAMLEHFFLAHSVSSHALEWGEGLYEEFCQSRGVLPFILHMEEGFDSDIVEEIEVLNRLGALAENTVLVNGIGFSDSDLELIAAKKASVVWTPEANRHIFGSMAPVAKMLDMGIPVVLGTDSPMKGSANLFDELRLARAISHDHLGDRLKSVDLIDMVTRRAAQVFRVGAQRGTIAEGKFADLLIFEDLKGDPFESFFALTPRDVTILTHRGVLVFGDEAFRNACFVEFDQFSEVLVGGRPKLIWGKPLQLLERISSKLGVPCVFPFLPIAEP